jgi:UDP-glucose 4-epimerase
MKCLVTGGAGFIGSHLVRALHDAGNDVTVLDNFSTGRPDNLEDLRVRIVTGDVRSLSDVCAAVEGMEYVFHLAALASVARSIKDPLVTHAVNATGTLHLLQAAHEAGVRRVIYASSSSVYGNNPELPKSENQIPAPASPYAVSKLTGEHYCRVFYQTMGLETTCVRFFNVFGPRQDPGSEYAAVIPRFTDAILNGDPPVIYGDGQQSRDFTYVGNAVEGTILAAQGQAAAGQVFNIACGERRSLLELIETLEDLLADHVDPQFEPPRAGDVRHSQASIGLAGRVLGYVPRVTFRQGLKETTEWYRTQHAANAHLLDTLRRKAGGIAAQAG